MSLYRHIFKEPNEDPMQIMVNKPFPYMLCFQSRDNPSKMTFYIQMKNHLMSVSK